MIGKASVIVIVIQFFLLPAIAQDNGYFLRKDLKEEWLTFDEGQYQKPEAEDLPKGVRYCKLEPARYTGDYLQVSSYRPFDLYINGQLIGSDEGSRFYKLDSLKEIYQDPLWLFAVHQEEIFAGDLVVRVVTPITLASDAVPASRPASYLRDFAVVAVLIVLVLLVVIIQINPKLASDYFSFSRVFSLRESDDSQVYTRISNSTNILVYVLCSLMAALCLLIIFHYTLPEYTNGFSLRFNSFWLAILQWIKLSAVILTIFFLKIFLVYIVSQLFGFRDVASIHFFNWIRIVLITTCVMTLVLAVYFISRGQSGSFYSGLIVFLGIMLTGITAILFFKLNGRVGQSIFHLFSYICATEVIPLLIIIKVLHQ